VQGWALNPPAVSPRTGTETKFEDQNHIKLGDDDNNNNNNNNNIFKYMLISTGDKF
jgi:hypothetical protein